MYSIYVDEIQIDIPDIKNIVLNAIVFDIANPENRGLKFSNKILLRKTANNIKAFKFYDDDLFDRTFQIDIYEKTILIIRGTAKVTEIGDYITIQIIDILKKLITNDLNIPLSDLDVDDDDFQYSMTSYNLIKNATSGSWSWELIDNRLDVGIPIKHTDIDPNLAVFRPHYNVLELVKQMFIDQGYTVDATALDSKASDLRMLSNAKDFLVSFYQTTQSAFTLTVGTDITLPTSGGTLDWLHQTDFGVFLSNEFYLIHTNHPSADHAIWGSYFIIEIDVDISCNFVVQIDTWSGGAPYTTESKKYYLHKRATIITDKFEENEDYTRYISFKFDRTVYVNRIRLIGMISEIDIYVNSGDITWNTLDTTSGWYRISTLPKHYPLLTGLYVKTKYNMPALTQFQLLKEFWKLFNISIKIESNTIYLTHNSLDGMIDIMDYAVNKPLIKNFPDYAVDNYFKYKNDIGLYRKKYNSKVLNKIFIEMLEDAGEDIEITELPTDFDLGYAGIYDVSSPANSDVGDRHIIEDMFFLATANDEPTEINADKKLIFNGLEFSTLYDNFYADYYDYLQDSKLVTYKIKIGYIIYLKLLNDGKIYDKTLGRELTILKISKYNPNGLTSLIALTREI